MSNVSVVLGWTPNLDGSRPLGYTVKYRPTGTHYYQVQHKPAFQSAILLCFNFDNCCYQAGRSRYKPILINIISQDNPEGERIAYQSVILSCSLCSTAIL